MQHAAPGAGSAPPRPPPGNRLLAGLTRGERALLAPALAPVTLRRGQVLVAQGADAARVFLPESGLVSLILDLPDRTSTEVGLIGREGVVGLPALLGEPVSPFRAVVRVPGQAWGIEAAELRVLADRSANLRQLVRRQAMDALLQAAANAACQAAHPLDQRAARWLLSAAERVGPGFPLTQEDLAASLGARRPSVNAVLAAFRDAGLLRQIRGQVALADLPGLEARSCACLGLLRRSQARPAPAAEEVPVRQGLPSAG